MSIGRPPASAVTRRILSSAAGMNFWPPQPGLTDITSTRSTRSITCSIVSTGVPGFIVTPAFLPSARIACSERCRCGPASTWTVMMSAPALAKASRCGSTGAIIRCTSKRLLADRADRLHHVRSEGDHRHEMAVHHVEMDPVGAGGLDRADLLGELREVRGQDRRGDAERARHEASLLPVEVTRGGKSGQRRRLGGGGKPARSGFRISGSA